MNKKEDSVMGFKDFTDKVYESKTEDKPTEKKDDNGFDLKTKIIVVCPECGSEFKTTIAFMLQNPNCTCQKCVRQKVKAMKDVKTLEDAKAKLKEYKVKFKMA